MAGSASWERIAATTGSPAVGPVSCANGGSAGAASGAARGGEGLASGTAAAGGGLVCPSGGGGGGLMDGSSEGGDNGGVSGGASETCACAGATAPQAKAWAAHKSTAARGPPRMPVSLANRLEISPRRWRSATPILGRKRARKRPRRGSAGVARGRRRARFPATCRPGRSTRPCRSDRLRSPSASSSS